jgi:hypothetical protein
MKIRDIHILNEKIRQQRKSRRNRRYYPFNNFYDKIERSTDLINAIERKFSYSQKIQEARLQFIIVEISTFELYFKDLFIYIFKACKYDDIIKRCFQLISEKYSLEDIYIIIKKKIKLEEMILNSFTFQNLDTIYQVFNIITKLNIKKELDKLKIVSKNEPSIDVELNNDYNKQLQEYINMRHNLVHDYDPKFKIRKNILINYHENLMDFVFAFDIITDNNFKINKYLNRKKKSK